MAGEFDWPNSSPLVGDDKYPTQDFMRWFVKLSQSAGASKSGVTADRPTKGIFIGLMWFDETLGRPIWVKGMTGNTVIWVNSVGTVV